MKLLSKTVNLVVCPMQSPLIQVVVFWDQTTYCGGWHELALAVDEEDIQVVNETQPLNFENPGKLKITVNGEDSSSLSRTTTACLINYGSIQEGENPD